MELNEMQKEVWDNKVKKGFNTTDVAKEFCYLYGEVGEAYDAFIKNKGKEEVGLELADVGLFLLGVSNMLGISLKEQMEKKIEINKNRVYIINDKGMPEKIEKK